MKKMRTSNKTITISLSLCVCVCGKVLTVLTRGGRGDGAVTGAVLCCVVWAPPTSKRSNRKRVPQIEVPCAILFIYFSCILFFALSTHTQTYTLIHTHMRPEQANFIFIFIISLRHINKSHGHTRRDAKRRRKIENDIK